jgi:hypothetical protein
MTDRYGEFPSLRFETLGSGVLQKEKRPPAFLAVEEAR